MASLRYFAYLPFLAVASAIIAPLSSPLTCQRSVTQVFEPGDNTSDFISRGRGYHLSLTPTEAVLRNGSGQPLRLIWSNANPAAQASGLNLLPGKTNYFIGNNPRRWKTGVANYGKVRYAQVYAGIDLVYYGTRRELEHDWVVSPGADPRQIRFQVEGADAVQLERNGDLILRQPEGDVQLRRPSVYQNAAGPRRRVEGGYRISGRVVSFDIGAYDPTKTLIIDPVLTYSTYVLSTGLSAANDIAVDSSGAAYIVGYIDRTDWTKGNAIGSAFVSKLSPDGSTILYTTYLGGNRNTGGLGIAVGSAGAAYITGGTAASDLPLLNPFQAALAGSTNGFVSKLGPSGSLVYSTYLGGDGTYASAIAVDASGAAYVAGNAASSFPTTQAFQSSFGGGTSDAFVTKLNPGGSTLAYSTYLGGSGRDYASGIAVDSGGNVYVVGATDSPNFPTLSPFQAHLAGATNAFITKLNAAGSALIYSTYLGGSRMDSARRIAVDSAGSAYVSGTATSVDFPVINAIQPNYIPSDIPCGDVCYTGNGFISKVNAAGSTLVYSTYLGKAPASVSGIAVDSSGSAYITGGIKYGSVPAVAWGPGGVVVGKLTSSGTELAYLISLGGERAYSDSGAGIALDAAGNVYVAGWTQSEQFTTSHAAEVAPVGSYLFSTGAFVLKLGPSNAPGIAFNPGSLDFNYYPVTKTVTVIAAGGSPLNITNIAVSGDFLQTNDCTTVAAGSTCTVNVTFVPTAAGSRVEP